MRICTLSNVCYLQSSTQPERALSTIREVLQLYNELPEPFTDEMLAEKVKSLLYQADVALVCHKEKLALDSMKEALLLQEPLMERMGKSTDYNILRFNLVNLQEARSLLTALESTHDSSVLIEQLQNIEDQFQCIVDEYNASRSQE